MEATSQKDYAQAYKELYNEVYLDRITALPGVATWWKENRSRLDPKFVEFVEKSGE